MEINFEDRICCFIDILGFKQHIKETLLDGQDDLKKIAAIKEILNEAIGLVKDNQNDEFNISKQVTQFSDSIVISFRTDLVTELLITLSHIMHLCMNGVRLGFLFRGGISYGKLIHTEEYLFGPAMITAYDIESKASIYPRIILDKSIIELAKKSASNKHNLADIEEWIDNVVTKDFDGMYYVDYISKTDSEFNDPAIELKFYIENLKEIILVNNNSSDDSIKIKYGWLKSKVNELFNRCKNNKQALDSLRKSDTGLAKYYENLDFIE